ncbi:MAG: hypothetical protein A2Y62_14330 [Candidatus Fischerbacteria bacterium RBG_13_37_8]|uniref:DUF5667 domain-containing protein n=1 Tax=Candidatus Fischerbacteria bacterium RBG_13_37_8 TaxID=1817863 RepID=A0A1F5VPN1_9BACT|nr:MAG: hypothetical protein A2Y62_14330 [Candidatus Fischerbacteria bacterium RBG_13_37_8]
MNRSIKLLMIFCLMTFSMVLAEEIPQKDTESTVPELIEFHDVIYQIWHNAYPAKDIETLKGFVKDIDAGFAKIEQAKLPGILRDKQDAWNKGLAEFKKAVEEYDNAAAGSDDQKLLDAAEELHARFELMIRIIRPIATEVDAYHRELYVVYHKYLPEKQYDQIKGIAGDMVNKAEAITKVVLSKRLESKTEKYQKAATVLLEKTKKLADTCKSDANDAIDKAVDDMHKAYQELVSIFE